MTEGAPEPSRFQSTIDTLVTHLKQGRTQTKMTNDRKEGEKAALIDNTDSSAYPEFYASPWYHFYAEDTAMTCPASYSMTTDSTVPNSTIPDFTIPDSTVPDPTMPDPTVPASIVTDYTVPDYTVPDYTAPDCTVPDPIVPKPTMPDNPASAPDPTVTVPPVPDSTISNPTETDPTVTNRSLTTIVTEATVKEPTVPDCFLTMIVTNTNVKHPTVTETLLMIVTKASTEPQAALTTPMDETTQHHHSPMIFSVATLFPHYSHPPFFPLFRAYCHSTD